MHLKGTGQLLSLNTHHATHEYTRRVSCLGWQHTYPHSARVGQQSSEQQRLLASLHTTRTTFANTLRAKAAAADDLARSLGQARVEEGSIAAQALQHALQLKAVEEQEKGVRDELRRVCWEQDMLVQRLARQQRALVQVQVRGYRCSWRDMILGMWCTTA